MLNMNHALCQISWSVLAAKLIIAIAKSEAKMIEHSIG